MKFNSWKSLATLKLRWKKALLIKKFMYSGNEIHDKSPCFKIFKSKIKNQLCPAGICALYLQKINAIIGFFIIILCIVQLNCQATKSRTSKKPLASCYVVKVLSAKVTPLMHVSQNGQAYFESVLEPLRIFRIKKAFNLFLD